MLRRKEKEGSTILEGGALTLQQAINIFHPVNSLLMTTDNINPGTRFPGTTWAAWGAGRSVVGVGNNGSNTYVSEQTFGADSITLTAAQSGVNAHTHTVGGTSGGNLNDHTHTGPSHTHEVDWNYVTGVNPSGSTLHFAVSIGGTYNSDGSDSTGTSEAAGTGNTGGQSAGHSHNMPSATGAVASPTSPTAHDNRQMSIATYVWKRTA